MSQRPQQRPERHHHHDEEHAEAHDHVHDHDDDIVPALQNLLYQQIDFSRLRTLNEDESDQGRSICQKTWAQRLDPRPELKSFADEQILMIVPCVSCLLQRLQH